MKYLTNFLNLKKLSKREKILITIFSIAGLIWISYNYIFHPQGEKIGQMAVELKRLDSEIHEINQVLVEEDQTRNKLSKTRSTILTIGNSYFPNLNQTQLIYYIEEIFQANDVIILDLIFNPTETEDINNHEVQYTTISIPFRGLYEDLLNLINHINTGSLKVIIDSLSLSDLNQDSMEGEIKLKVYTLENIFDLPTNKLNLRPRNDENLGELDDSIEDDLIEEEFRIDMGLDSANRRSITDRTVVDDFQEENCEFVASNGSVKGGISRYEEDNTSFLRFEYYIENNNKVDKRAYLDISKKNIQFSNPISKLIFRVKSFSQSSGKLGLRFKTSDNEILDMNISDSISWTGWKSIEFSLPADISIYPLDLVYIYYEGSHKGEDIGVLIFDKLEAINDRNKGKAFYLVKDKDTLSSISIEVYGSDSYVEEIMQNNNLISEDDIYPGKILILNKGNSYEK